MLSRAVSLAIVASMVGVLPAAAQAPWEPTRTIEFIVPAGTGGGADQMARVVQGIVAKHNLSKQQMVVVNKAGGAGAEGFLDVKGSRANPHKLVITLSNLFTTPLATGVPFNWRDLTPVAMLALDEFVLWVNAQSPHRTVRDFVNAARAAGANPLKMGGTGSKQEDQIITVAIENAIGAKFTYIPYTGGGQVATQLVGGHVDATVNNPIEAVAHWRAGTLRPLCVFDPNRLPVTEKITETQAWSDIPTCASEGLNVNYLMLRGIFASPGLTDAQVAYYVQLMRRVRETPEWTELMKNGAFNTTFMVGNEYRAWVEREENRHKELMQAADFLFK